MLKIDVVYQIEDVTVYGDDTSYYTFYAIPQTPRFRLDKGVPAFKFLKYRELRKEGSDLFGGICTFDTEFVVDQDTRELVRQKLQAQVDADPRNKDQPKEVVFAPLPYTSGTVQLNITDEGGALVESVRCGGKPSNFGNNVASFWVELSKAGATVFESAMNGDGGFVSVHYDMKLMVKLPPITARGVFNADKFYKFFHEITGDRYTETQKKSYLFGLITKTKTIQDFQLIEDIDDYMEKNEGRKTEFTFVGDPSMSAEDRFKIEEVIRNTLIRQLDEAVERNLLQEIERVVPDPKNRELIVEKGWNYFKEVITSTQITNIVIEFEENRVVEWNISPNGTLPNLTTIKDPSGKYIKWGEPYFKEVDLNDPFFQYLDIIVRVNADFSNLPIFNVKVKMSYPHGQDKPVETFAFSEPNDVNRFRAFIANGIRKYKYDYQVNYKGEKDTFTSQVFETDDTQLTVNVDDLGILVVDIAPGDINFAQVDQAQIVVRYEDTGVKIIEHQFNMLSSNTINAPEKNIFKIRDVIFKARTKPIQYRVKYFMRDGRVFETQNRHQDGKQIYINDPFSAIKHVGLRAIGDLDSRIQTIMVDLVYIDATNNNYTKTHSMALSREMPFFDWTFPVIDEHAGILKYSGTISYRNGTTQNIPETIATSSTILLGDMVADRLEVPVLPYLIDFTAVRLITVALRYVDAPNNIDERKTMTFKPGDGEQLWIVDLKNKAARDFTWSAVFYMADGLQKRINDHLEQNAAVVLEVPD